MQLHYYRDPLGNFGDDLNPWLWPQLLPGLLDDDPDELLVGIGTLLNHRLPAAPHKHVLGSGVGYGRLPQIDRRWTFHAVRGPYSAAQLGLPADSAVCDAAILLRLVEARRGGCTDGPVGFMPTGQTLDSFDWASLCRENGLRFISPRGEPRQVVGELLGCRRVLCEAMHAAIVCDALRIPWVAVRCTPDVLAAKWRDWLAAVGLDYQPVDLPTLHGQDGGLRDELKRWVGRVGLGGHITPPPPRPSPAWLCAEAQVRLVSAAGLPGVLSDDRCLEQRTEQLAWRLAHFRQGRVGACPGPRQPLRPLGEAGGAFVRPACAREPGPHAEGPPPLVLRGLGGATGSAAG